MKHVGDITKLNGAELEPVWCITGGSPCQDLSVAGERAGLAGARSGLFMEQVRLVKEMRENDKRNGRTGDMVRPRYMVWENVPGAFSSNFSDGFGDFGAVLEEVIRVAEPTFSLPRLEGKQKWTKSGAIDGDGWSVAWRTHDAQYWGVPQRRRRISLVADFGGSSAGEILFERQGVRGYFAEGRTPWQAAPGDAQDCAGADDRAGESGGGAGGRGLDAVAYGIVSKGNGEAWPIAEKHMALSCGGGQAGQGYPCAMAPYTLKTSGPGAVVVGVDGYNAAVTGDVSSSLGVNCGMSTGRNGVAYRTIRWIVRRLTPLECTRLQGFPDGWIEIGEWVDSEGKKHKDADSPKYKALGNSIALPFWYWMFCRMAKYLPRDATLGSLFDGIGGFPICWEAIHGRGTARWASEIEEFPIAVTKMRFGED